MVDLIDHYNELPSATNIKNTFWDTYTPYGIIVKQERRKGLTNCMGMGHMMGGMGFIGMIFGLSFLACYFMVYIY